MSDSHNVWQVIYTEFSIIQVLVINCWFPISGTDEKCLLGLRSPTLANICRDASKYNLKVARNKCGITVAKTAPA